MTDEQIDHAARFWWQFAIACLIVIAMLAYLRLDDRLAYVEDQVRQCPPVSTR